MKATLIIAMSRRTNKTIKWLTIVIMLFACSEKGSVKGEKSLYDSLTVVDHKKSKAEFDTSFYKLYKSIMDTSISDERNFDILQKKFFGVALPTKSAYCFYFRFIQLNMDASLSEEVSMHSYNLWKEDKDKCVKIIEHANKLPVEIRSIILKSLVQAICLDLNANDYNLKLFKKDFPSLRDSASLGSAKSCFDNWIE